MIVIDYLQEQVKINPCLIRIRLINYSSTATTDPVHNLEMVIFEEYM